MGKTVRENKNNRLTRDESIEKKQMNFVRKQLKEISVPRCKTRKTLGDKG